MKKTKLFVGGLEWSMDDANLKTLFEKGDTESGAQGCGEGSVIEAKVICERDTGRSKGFAFVTLDTLENAEKARQEFNGRKISGRVLKVDEADDKSSSRREGSPFRRAGNSSGGFSSGYSFKKKREY